MNNDELNGRMQAILDQDKSLENDLAMINSLKANLNNEKKENDVNMVEVTTANTAPASETVVVKVSEVTVNEPPFVNPTSSNQIPVVDPATINPTPIIQEVVQSIPQVNIVPVQPIETVPVTPQLQVQEVVPIPQQPIASVPQANTVPVQPIPVNNSTPTTQAVINNPEQVIQQPSIMPNITPAPTMNIPTQQVQMATPVKPTSTQTLYKKRAAENLANLENITIQNWATLSNEIRYENMVKIIGLSSAKVAAALGMQPANRVTQAVRGQRPFKPEIIQIVFNWFMTNEELLKHPQLRALVTPELFSTPKVK